jgi:hypothetical protein
VSSFDLESKKFFSNDNDICSVSCIFYLMIPITTIFVLFMLLLPSGGESMGGGLRKEALAEVAQ